MLHSFSQYALHCYWAIIKYFWVVADAMIVNLLWHRTEFDDDCTPPLNDDIHVRDIHCVSSLLKLYFRELPNPLLTYQLYDKFVVSFI